MVANSQLKQNYHLANLRLDICLQNVELQETEMQKEMQILHVSLRKA